METFLEILKLLYPLKSEIELKTLALKCDSFLVREFYEQEWKDIELDNLGDLEVQLRLVKTFYQLSFGYYGVANEILDSLELWGGESMVFEIYNEETRYFLNIIYTFLAFSYFNKQNVGRQIFLLGSRFLPLAITLQISVYNIVKEEFLSTCDIDNLTETALFFSNSIANNHSSLGQEEEGHAIFTWIEIFNKFKKEITDSKNLIDDFYKKDKEFSKLEITDKIILIEILNLYDDLFTGKIWRDAEKPDCIHEKTEIKKTINIIEEYFNLLEKSPDINPWLEDHKEVAEWLNKQTDKENFEKIIIKILKEKVNLKNTAQTSLTLEFLEDLKNNNIVKNADILYFDESEGKFKWSI